MLIVGAWLMTLIAQSTGNAALLHHQALVVGGPPPWMAVPIFLLGWQVMIVAMMLPASLPSVAVFSAGAERLARPRQALAIFLASYAFIWTAFGLVALSGDAVLHRFVDATPWLAARPWLIEAAVLALAGAWQLTPLKRRCLAACRHPAGLLSTTLSRRGAFAVAVDHGLACLGSSWALMLLMFAEGFGNLWWMIALTALMAYETNGRDGQRGALVAGAFLLLFAAVVA
jgi:predicted metal-binding membrane protein